ncbi:MAG: phosphate ABC transporter permease subunit PstC [Actinobacteria bacterium]|nr:phosphate ABC transporter permease subunit PstC [Actinomycetota bacterium]
MSVIPSAESQQSNPFLRSANKERHRRERRVRLIFKGVTFLTLGISALLILSLAGQAFQFLSHIDLSSLNSIGWFPRRGFYDIGTLIVGTALVTGIAMVVATPLGIGAAVYLSEFASPRMAKYLKPILEVLAGIPSVVVGYFALSFIGPDIVQSWFDTSQPQSLMAAGVGVGILIVPLIASICEDAFSAVPRELREASYGLGARSTATTLKVVIPAAFSGVVAALILAISRAFGETMVVAIAAGGSGGSLFTKSPLEQGQTLTGAVASVASGTDAVAGASEAFNSLYFVSLVLFVITLALNILGGRLVRSRREKY